MYKIRYGSKVVKGRITAIERALDLDNVADDVLEPEKVALNDIAHINVEVAEELPVEDYAARGAVGNFLVTDRSEEHTSELQSRFDLVCRVLLAQKETYRV